LICAIKFYLLTYLLKRRKLRRLGHATQMSDDAIPKQVHKRQSRRISQGHRDHGKQVRGDMKEMELSWDGVTAATGDRKRWH